jgi:hypothetical protein
MKFAFEEAMLNNVRNKMRFPLGDPAVEDICTPPDRGRNDGSVRMEAGPAFKPRRGDRL